MFIRTRDDARIVSGENTNIPYISFLESGENVTKSIRKWNIIKKYKIAQREIEYFNDELICKKIPKEHGESFNTIDIKIIITADSNVLIFQEFDEYPCNFLTLDDETGLINTINFYDIQLDKTEIFCFDVSSNDYYLSSVQSAVLLAVDNPIQEIHTKELYDMSIKEHLKLLSNYILHCDQHTGMIINNIFVF